jgi:hypothetical protein
MDRVDFEEHKEIDNAKLVIDHFGYWPTFHDSEIISIIIQRTLDKATSSATLRVYSFEMTDQMVGGHDQLVKHCFFDVEITDLIKTEIDGFNHQNAVLALEFGRDGENVFCNIVSTYGVDGYIGGKKIRIKRLEPITDDNVVKG